MKEIDPDFTKPARQRHWNSKAECELVWAYEIAAYEAEHPELIAPEINEGSMETRQTEEEGASAH